MHSVRKTLFVLTLLSLCLAFALAVNLADRDLWHRFATGRLVLEQGGMPDRDVFSYMPVKERWVDHEWGSGVVFYLVYRLLGMRGIAGLKIILFFLPVVLIVRSNRRRYPEAKPFRIFFYAAVLYGLFMAFLPTLRCHAWTYLFFTLWLDRLERLRRGEPVRTVFFPLSMLVWVNLHGGFVAGLGLAALFAFGEAATGKVPRRPLGILCISLLATFVNPWGPGFWEYVIHAVSLARTRIVEWRALDLFGPPGEWLGFKVMLAATAGAWIAAFFRKRLPRHPAPAVVCLVTLLLALRHQRHTTFFVIASAMLSYGMWDALMRDCRNAVRRVVPRFSEKTRTAFGWVSEAAGYVLLLGFAWGVIVRSPLEPVLPESEYPVGAVRFMREKKYAGNLLVSFNWGSYCLWTLYPSCRVSMDGRYEETYPERIFRAVSDFFRKEPGWEAFLSGYPHDFILTRRRAPVRPAVEKLDAWVVRYRDAHAVLFERRDRKNAEASLPGGS
jgi:hypothetical protein